MIRFIPERRWSIERRIPVSVLLTILIHFVMVVSWATYLEARVSALEVNTQDLAPLTEKFGRLEERIEGLRVEISLLRQTLHKKPSG